MKIACGTVLFRQHPLDVALETIREIGFAYVETQAVGPWCPHVRVDRDDPIAFAQKVAGHGFLGVTALWMPCGTILSDERSVTWAVRTIEWASAAGIPVVNTGDGFKPPDMDDETAYDLYARRMSDILVAARKAHTIIAIEPHGTFSLTGRGLKRLMELSDSPWLGVNYDPCNVRRAGYVQSRPEESGWISLGENEDEVSVLEGILPRVVHVHAKDYQGGACVALGEGDVRLLQCLELLRRFGYAGAVSLETEGDESFEVAREFAKKGYAYLMEHCVV